MGRKTEETEQREAQIQERTQTQEREEGEPSAVSVVTVRSFLLVAFLSHFIVFLFPQHKKKSKKHKHKGKQKKKKTEETESSTDDSYSDGGDVTKTGSVSNKELLQRSEVLP